MNRKIGLLWTRVILTLVITVLPGVVPYVGSGVAVAMPELACVVIQPDGTAGQDSYIKEDKPDERKGGDKELRVKTQDGVLNRALLQFSTSSVPSGAVIDSATLFLYVKGASGGNATVNARPITASWNETEVTWNDRDKDASLPWGAAGGDYGAVESWIVVGDTADIWVSWDLTTMVGDWVGDPASNYGVMLEGAATDPKTEKKFVSSDDGAASQRPKLEVCYTQMITVAPDFDEEANAGDVLVYDHSVTNHQAATDCVTVAAASSEGWALQLQDSGGLSRTNPFSECVASGASYDFQVEVTVAGDATCGDVDQTVVTAASDNLAGVSDMATDTTWICRPPQVDGLLDVRYVFDRRFTLADGADAPANLYKDELGDMCYWALLVDRAFNDNVYADDDASYLLEDGWTGGHDYSKLEGSDEAVFAVDGVGSLTIDYIDGSYQSPASPPINEAATSLVWNMTSSGWDGGIWGDPEAHSPPYDWSGDWEWQMIYEFSIPKSAPGMGGICPEVTLASAHNSPSKDKEDLGKIGDRVWEDADSDKYQDSGEVGLPGVTVRLYAGDCPATGDPIRTTQTEPGTSGEYIFSNLDGGTYCVEVDESTLPAGYGLTTGNKPMPVTIPTGGQIFNADFGFAPPTPELEISKTLNTPGTVYKNDPVVFTIEITNMSDLWIGVLPMQDVYSTTYLGYGYEDKNTLTWTYADPDSFDQEDVGAIDWDDLTVSLGDLAPNGQPGDSVTVVVTFTAKEDTSLLPPSPFGETENRAVVEGALADPDGGGPLEPVIPVPLIEDSDVVSIASPTVVEGVVLSSMQADVRRDGAELGWETANELAIVGFNVHRRVGEQGECEQLNKEFIFAQHSGADDGASYVFRDVGIESGVTYCYLLEVVLEGQATYHRMGVVRTGWWLELPLVMR